MTVSWALDLQTGFSRSGKSQDEGRKLKDRRVAEITLKKMRRTRLGTPAGFRIKKVYVVACARSATLRAASLFLRLTQSADEFF
jgi:hypothetical protein